MVYYFVEKNADGSVKSLLTYNDVRPNITDPLVVEITQEEYETLLAEIMAQEPEEPEEPETDEISAEEALDIILGGEGV